MKIVMVNLVDNLYRFYANYAINQPPLSLGVLANLTSDNFDVEILDEQVDWLRFNGDVFAFSLCTQLAKKTYAIADRLREQGKIVIIGGYHATVMPDECSKHADSVVVGEAEHSWPKLLEDLKKGKLKKIYRSSPGKLAVPVIKRHLFKNNKYNFPNTLFISRGCNFNCDFCVSSKIFGKYRVRPLEDVEKELDCLMQKGWKKTVMLVDDNPFVDKQYTMKMLDLFRRKNIRWAAQITMEDLADRNFVKKLRQSGCICLGVGIESITEESRASFEKCKLNLSQLNRSVRHANSLGIAVMAFLIFGLETDTIMSLKRSIKLLKKIPFSYYDINGLRVLPGSALYEKMLKENKVKKDWWLMEDEPHYNEVLPGYLRIYHDSNIPPRKMQMFTLKSFLELNNIFSLRFNAVIIQEFFHGNFTMAFRQLAGRMMVWIQAKRLIRHMRIRKL